MFRERYERREYERREYEEFYKYVEKVREPVVIEERARYKLIERDISCPPNCPNPLKAFETLRERVRDARLDPLEHKAQCLRDSKLNGLFGSVLKGTYSEHSDVDFAVWMPADFSVDKHVKPLFDRVFYMLRASYGLIVYGLVENTPVDLYFVNRNKRLHAFYIDEELACMLKDSDRDEANRLKKLGKEVGAYGEFGGVPGVAIEYAIYTANNKRVDVEDILLWRYLPAKGLSTYMAGNLLGRTFKINQIVLSDAIKNGYRGDTPRERYLSKVVGYAANKNYIVEYFISRESLPLFLVYDAAIAAMSKAIGTERYRYLGYDMGVFGIAGNEYIIGLIGIMVGYKREPLATAPDRIDMLMPTDCSLENAEGINYEGGIVCVDEPIRVVRLREVVRSLYVSYRSALSAKLDRFISVRIV